MRSRDIPLSLVVVLWGTFIAGLTPQASAQSTLTVGFALRDITPKIDPDKPVYIAGYGQNRKATGVHDPLYARVFVLSDGRSKIALASVDLVGMQYPDVLAVRSMLKGFTYVMVSSTHNHEGPDVVGLWGPSETKSGVDPAYIRHVQEKIAEAVREADETKVPAKVRYGEAKDREQLLRDARLPIVYDDVLRILDFQRANGSGRIGILVQWNCHPESMDSKNTEITADFCHPTIAILEKKYRCHVGYFTGTVGGLLTVPEDRFKDAAGNFLRGGDWALMSTYGEAVAKLAIEAIEGSSETTLTPIRTTSRVVALPLANPGYRALRLLGVLTRDGYANTGDPYRLGEKLPPRHVGNDPAMATEVGYLRLGEVSVALIPGEIYPELVYGQYQEPVDPNADFPDAPLEVPVMKVLPGTKKFLFGLANDEVGYILPKRQWDMKAPYCYGRKERQYGEINSVGPDVGPILLKALADCVADAEKN